MKKTCMLSGNFALDTIVTRDYPNGFVVPRKVFDLVEGFDEKYVQIFGSLEHYIMV